MPGDDPRIPLATHLVGLLHLRLQADVDQLVVELLAGGTRDAFERGLGVLLGDYVIELVDLVGQTEAHDDTQTESTLRRNRDG